MREIFPEEKAAADRIFLLTKLGQKAHDGYGSKRFEEATGRKERSELKALKLLGTLIVS